MGQLAHISVLVQDAHSGYHYVTCCIAKHYVAAALHSTADDICQTRHTRRGRVQ